MTQEVSSQRDAALPSRRGFLAGLLATLVMVAIVAILRYTTNVQSLPEVVAEGLVGLMPAVVFSTILDRLQKAAQPILYVGILAGMLGVGGLLGRGFAYGALSWKRAATLGLVIWAAIGLVILPLLGVGLFGSTLRGGLIILAIEQAIVCLGFAAALLLILRALEPAASLAPDTAAVSVADEAIARRQRRTALASIVGGLVVIAAGGAAWRAFVNAGLSAASSAGSTAARPSSSAASTPASDGASTAASAPPPAPAAAAPPVAGSGAPAAGQVVTGPGAGTSPPRIIPSIDLPAVPMTVLPDAPNPSPYNVDGLTAEVLNPAQFYTVSKNIIDPDVNVSGWSLKIDGLVDHPGTYVYDDIKALPVYSDYYTLQCISNEVGGELWGNAHWTGVRLIELLSRAGLQAGIRKVVFHAEDGYTDSIPLDDALRADALLAYEMNGQPLTKAHGYPARLLIPGIYGMKNVKWINRIELVNYDYKGYWATRGWSDIAPYNTATRIDAPRTRATPPAGEVTLAGVTFAGARGIDKVEVSLDDGNTWEPATLKPALSQNAWNLWLLTKTMTPGTYNVKARAVDGTGAVQTPLEADPVPSGSTGYHTILLRVTA